MNTHASGSLHMLNHSLHFSQHIHRNINLEAECGIHGKRKVNGLNNSSTQSVQKDMAPPPVFLPGKSHGQRGLEGYSPWVTRVGHNLVTSPPPPGAQSVPGTGQLRVAEMKYEDSSPTEEGTGVPGENRMF